MIWGWTKKKVVWLPTGTPEQRYWRKTTRETANLGLDSSVGRAPMWQENLFALFWINPLQSMLLSHMGDRISGADFSITLERLGVVDWNPALKGFAKVSPSMFVSALDFEDSVFKFWKRSYEKFRLRINGNNDINVLICLFWMKNIILLKTELWKIQT